MASDLDQLLRDILGNVSQFSSEQMKKLQGRLQDFAREALKDEFARLNAEIADLRSRLAALESKKGSGL